MLFKKIAHCFEVIPVVRREKIVAGVVSTHYTTHVKCVDATPRTRTRYYGLYAPTDKEDLFQSRTLLGQAHKNKEKILVAWPPVYVLQTHLR